MTDYITLATMVDNMPNSEQPKPYMEHKTLLQRVPLTSRNYKGNTASTEPRRLLPLDPYSCKMGLSN